MNATALETTSVLGPDVNGEFALPLHGALWMAATYQIPQIPLNGKAPFLPDWPSKASTDPTQIRAWSEEYAGCNFGSVAVPGSHFIFESDSSAVPERFKAQGNDFTAKLVVEGRQGEHRYYLSAPKVENTAQHAVKHADFSIRADGEQCVSPGSIHPITGRQYRVAVTGSLTAPTPEEVEFWTSEKNEKSTTSVRSQAMVPEGRRSSTLMSIAGSYLDLGEKPDQVKERISELNQERCTPPLSEEELTKTIFASIDRYAQEPDAITRMAKEIRPFLASSEEGGQKGRMMEFVRGDSIQPKRLQWLWRGRILADKLNVFSGEPDVGKGMTTCDFAARLTKHWDFPDAKNELDGPKDVVFLSSEDDMEDTIVPRLIVAGADMKRIHFVQISENSTKSIEEGIVCLDRDLPALEEMIKRHPDVVLIIPDPVIAFLGDADPNKDKDVRPIYSKMKAFAKRLNVAWLFVNHWNKNQTASSINRTSGAKTMVSAPRATWMFTRSPEDPTRFLMMKGKGNLSGNKTKTLAYRIIGVSYDFGDGLPVDPDGVPKLVWDGETEHNTEDVLKDQNDPKTRRNTKAEELLSTLLKDGAKKAKDVYSAGDKENLDKNQMQRARYKLGYVAKPIDGTWYWAKSDEDILRRKEQLFTPHPVTFRSKPDVDLDARVN